MISYFLEIHDQTPKFLNQSHTFPKPHNKIFETEFRPVKMFLVAGRIANVVGMHKPLNERTGLISQS